MPRPTRSKVRLVADGTPIEGREWVTSGGIPDETEGAVIPRGYSFLGDDNLGDIALPYDCMVGFQSEYVLRAGWYPTHESPEAGSLFVVFLSLACCRYDAAPMGLWQDLFASPSHGRFVNEVLAGIEYVELRPVQRKVTAEMKAANFARTN